MSNKKEFSIEIYEDSDLRGKKYAIQFLSTTFDFKLKSDKEVFIYDLLMFNHWGNEISVEIEQKKSWIGYKFPFKTLDIPYRKKKNKADLFIMFNNNFTAVAVIDMEVIKKRTKIKKDTIYTTNESFYRIELCHVKFYEYHGIKWYRDWEYDNAT